MRPMIETLLRQAKRLIVLVVGGTILLVGVVFLFTPGQGILTIVAGLALLGTEFVWARRLLRRLRAGGQELGRLMGWWWRKTGPGGAPATDCAGDRNKNPTSRSNGMTSKERMMRALNREKPDRLPVTIHQWQDYHLKQYMNGMDALSAFKATGMDAALQYFEAMGQFWIAEAAQSLDSTPDWREEIQVIKDDPAEKSVRHIITTPGGTLTFATTSNATTTWITDYLIKHHEDIDLIDKYMPIARIDKQKVAAIYDELGNAGILRGFVWGDQAGCWQHACCLKDTTEMIMEAHDNPDWVHRLLQVLLDKKLRFIEEQMPGVKFDLVETGGGAGSDTVISPKMHREFCLPYDRRMHQALHKQGFKITYHTCGGMVHILDQIIANETDASETLSPPGTGGNIREPGKVRKAFAGKVAMIGGMDQFNVLTSGRPEQIRSEVRRLFEGFGPDGGYILAASDHFFDAPVENLKIYAEAARECVY